MTDDDEIAEKAQVLSCHGMSAGAWNRYGKEGSWRYDIEEPGYKYNMFDIQAALALTQLSRMEDMQRRRFEAVEVYQQAFADVRSCGCKRRRITATTAAICMCCALCRSA